KGPVCVTHGDQRIANFDTGEKKRRCTRVENIESVDGSDRAILKFAPAYEFAAAEDRRWGSTQRPCPWMTHDDGIVWSQQHGRVEDNGRRFARCLQHKHVTSAVAPKHARSCDSGEE